MKRRHNVDRRACPGEGRRSRGGWKPVYGDEPARERFMFHGKTANQRPGSPRTKAAGDGAETMRRARRRDGVGNLLRLSLVAKPTAGAQSCFTAGSGSRLAKLPGKWVHGGCKDEGLLNGMDCARSRLVAGFLAGSDSLGCGAQSADRSAIRAATRPMRVSRTHYASSPACILPFAKIYCSCDLPVSPSTTTQLSHTIVVTSGGRT
ncbi:hypothetical protein ANO11243_058050 [Dothideomycetidae sp. 11243]|nr:hypothetical protein ANO11243_058050 [fungal sp. No.11243]